MATLLQSPPNPLSLADVALISQQLADELGQMFWRSEGFSVEDYLSFDGNYFLEYVDGCLQVLPMPDAIHQALVVIFANLLMTYSKGDLNARTKISPFRIRLSKTQFREADVCFMKGKNAGKRNDKFWLGADLAVEIVSESNRDHDYETKMREYAIAGIPEYWIIDPAEKVVRVFTLSNAVYLLDGSYGLGQTAISPSLEGFMVDVADLFAQAEAQA